jgi:hypothetical protein
MIPTPSDVQEKLSSLENLDATVESLMTLYQSDSEAFFAVACVGVEDTGDHRLRRVAELASQLLAAVRNGFEVLPASAELGGEICSKDSHIRFEHATTTQVLSFLECLDGSSEGERSGKDYRGTRISDAEIRFKLGDKQTWAEERRKFANRLNVRPTLLHLSDEDRQAVTNGMPGYIAYELIYCVPPVLASPTVVFEGLRKQGALKKGRAYCGRPRRAYDNNGNPSPRPDGMIFVVFVDQDNFVFDWDWVKEDPQKEGYPENYSERFAAPVIGTKEVVLTGIESIAPSAFMPSRAWYCHRGNCVFVYFSDEPAFAERVNDDVTVFKALRSHDVVGCKIKNIEKKQVKDQPQVAVLLAESLMRCAQEDMPISGYGKLISGLESNRPKVIIPKAGKFGAN